MNGFEIGSLAVVGIITALLILDLAIIVIRFRFVQSVRESFRLDSQEKIREMELDFDHTYKKVFDAREELIGATLAMEPHIREMTTELARRQGTGDQPKNL